MWRIVSGLGISFTTLIEEAETEVTVVSPEDVEPFHEAEGAYRVYPLFSYNLRTKFESYMVIMDPGCDHGSEAHNDGVEEYILCIRESWSCGAKTKATPSLPEALCISRLIGLIGTLTLGMKPRNFTRLFSMRMPRPEDDLDKQSHLLITDNQILKS